LLYPSTKACSQCEADEEAKHEEHKQRQCFLVGNPMREEENQCVGGTYYAQLV
jgi:hypothetical protein